MNFSDLFVVVALGSGLYAVLVALTGQRQFLLRAVNPHRLTWLIAGASVLWVGLSLMRWEAGNWEPHTWGGLFVQLVSDEPTPVRVKVASLALFFSVLLAVLVLWCVVFSPATPAPSAARPTASRRSATTSGCAAGSTSRCSPWGTGNAWRKRPTSGRSRRGARNLPKVKVGEEPPRARTAKDQVEFWRQLAARVHERMKELDQLVETAHQGHNRRLVFDCEYGGLFFRYLRLPDPANQVDTGLYLFAATLNQTEMTNGRAEQHFQLLLDALHHIDRAVRVA